MSFEIRYTYYEKSGDDYDRSETKEIVKRIGSEYEDVPLEKLAKSIISQLARRDIFIINVDINETVKRKVSFKETKGGVLIKNKKFMLDGSVELVADDSDVDDVQLMPQPTAYDRTPNQAIRWEVFDPDPPILAMLQSKFRVTPKRKYPILEEKTVIQRVTLPGAGLTEMPAYEYLIIDDQGHRVRVPSMHFTPEQKGLIGMGQMMTEKDYANAPKLMHMAQYSDPGMPVLRG